jgi:phosphotransferase system IIB component
MSILNCYTRLTVVNNTGLDAVFEVNPEENNMRIQPVENANVKAVVGTSAVSVSDWIKEWISFISYGPTYTNLTWSVAACEKATTRFQLLAPLKITVKWVDPSVSWKTHVSGEWSIDISKAVDVTLFLKSDIGEYGHRQQTSGLMTVASVNLKPYLEIACDDEIPFSVLKHPVAEMYWRPGIDVNDIIKPSM